MSLKRSLSSRRLECESSCERVDKLNNGASSSCNSGISIRLFNLKMQLEMDRKRKREVQQGIKEFESSSYQDFNSKNNLNDLLTSKNLEKYNEKIKNDQNSPNMDKIDLDIKKKLDSSFRGRFSSNYSPPSSFSRSFITKKQDYIIINGFPYVKKSPNKKNDIITSFTQSNFSQHRDKNFNMFTHFTDKFNHNTCENNKNSHKIDCNDFELNERNNKNPLFGGFSPKVNLDNKTTSRSARLQSASNVRENRCMRKPPVPTEAKPQPKPHYARFGLKKSNPVDLYIAQRLHENRMSLIDAFALPLR